MLYLVALERFDWRTKFDITDDKSPLNVFKAEPICGVRYNVVRRDCPIRPHAQKVKQGKRGRKTLPDEPDTVTPAETEDHFIGRLLDDYVRAAPTEWFVRFNSRVSVAEVADFRRQCLDPLLENVADDAEWWHWCHKKGWDHWDYTMRSNVFPTHCQRHFRFPFGVYNPLVETGYTEYDEYLRSGSESGLRRADSLFPELQ